MTSARSATDSNADLRWTEVYTATLLMGLAAPIPVDVGRASAEIAERAAGEMAERMRSEAAERSRRKAEVEEERIAQLYRHRMMSAQDRIEQSGSILERMKASEEEGRRTTIPMWEANLKRAEVELEQIRDDREDALRDLEKRRNPTLQFDLLNVARIEPEREPSG